ncbi:putative siderophore-binding lipoprotein YfiY precursor [Oxobacter pfennigii]|uniref:Putative siderophore-binding lipoprotein YfiY n=1 Tax=Oxobacter pfennigii TaxID=36849 RepID=A0A0P8WW31_9CLOT|nr:iron-siderophore ABC transporter substrate-binding protein [Oxobacter pfennigii]KPU42454.1 putative siderophore-binding lipoprotein YfiY precursor [Oxobacter pfennigii]
MKLKQFTSSILAIALSVFLIACSNNTSDTPGKENTPSGGEETAAVDVDTAEAYPITIKHAFGETIIESKPERIATISWGNQDVPLALGVIPVGISEANYGVTDGSGLLPWTKEGFKKLGVDNPVLFKDTDGLAFEAVSDSEPDVILAAYSGITQEEYDLLTQIAPVVAYPAMAWQTYWRDQIIMDAAGMGMKAEGEKLVSELEQLISQKIAAYPKISGKTAAFFYFNPSDLGKFYVYLPADPRAAYLTDLGLKFPESVLSLANDSESFAVEISAENVDILKDVDIAIAYGNAPLLKSLQSDSLMGTMPAIQRGSVALIQDGTPLAASGTPSALSIPATIDEYLSVIGKAADLVQ